MELKSDLEILILAARQTIERCGDASDRIELLEEEIQHQREKLSENREP